MILNSPTISGSLTVTGNIIASGSITLSGSVASASYAATASFVALAQSASNAVSAATASFANTFTVASTLTAQTLVVQTITSSVDFVTGSTRFGSLSSNTHIITGSMYVTGAFYVTSGSVGIGMTSPNYNLQLHNPASSDTRFQITNTTTGTTGGVGIQLITFGNDAVLTNRSNGYLIFETNSTERIRITSAGSVLINTSSSLFTGTIQMLGSNADGLLVKTTGATNNLPFITWNSFATSNPEMMRFYSDATQTNRGGIYYDRTNDGIVFNGATSAYIATGGTNRLSITSAGLVGIGTSSPASTLSVAATSDTTNLGSTGLTIGGASTLTSGNVLMLNFTPIGASSARARAGIGCVVGADWGKGNLTFYTRDASNSSAMTTADERMRITQDGYVGIGTSSPPKLLTLYTAGSTIMRFQSGAATTDHWDAEANTSARFYISNVSSGNGAYLVYNSASGWVGVSDARWKTNWTDLGPSLSLISQLKIGKYKMLDKDKQSIEGARWDYGVKAQELLDIIPDAVDVPNNLEDKHGVLHNIVFYHAIKAIQELKTQNDALQSRIETLESK